MSQSVFRHITRLLEEHSVPFDVLRHEPVYTSLEAARVRGTSLSSGAKALVCKADGRFIMIVLPANLRLDSKRVRRGEGISSLRFADRDEVQELTGLAPGAIPPLGSLFSLPTWCDDRLGQETRINFNAGDHATSISMAYADYVKVEKPRLGLFAH